MPRTTIKDLEDQLTLVYQSSLTRCKLPQGRTQRLRAYTYALCDPLLEHVEEYYLTSDELVTCLAAAALYVHMKLHVKKIGVPERETISQDLG
jgi:hypothetical protein